MQVTLPKPNTWNSSFPARLEDGDGEEGTSGSNPLVSQGGGGGGRGGGRGGAAAAGGGCSNPATDGVYVYVWDGGSKRVHKV